MMFVEHGGRVLATGGASNNKDIIQVKIIIDSLK